MNKILITGGHGFVGKNIVPLFKRYEVFTPTFDQADFRDPKQCRRWVKGMDIVVHLAGNVGGIGYNMDHPAELFYDNALMGIQLIHEAYEAGVAKMVVVGTVCAYPKYTKVPFKEIDLWDGYPEETNAPYGIAKKILLTQAQAYRKQYGFNCIYLLPVNMYGPYDNFDPRTSHVIPALIRKFIEAKKKNEHQVFLWGTGKATRQFLYAKDFGKAILKALAKYNDPEPLNIASGKEISIDKLAKLIKKLVGYKGLICYEGSVSDGQPRRCLDTTRAESLIGFKATTTFEEGLKETIKSYLTYV